MRSQSAGVGLKSNMTDVLIKKERHRDRQSGSKPRDDRGRGYWAAASGQGTPRTAGHHQKLRETRKASPQGLRGAWPH